MVFLSEEVVVSSEKSELDAVVAVTAPEKVADFFSSAARVTLAQTVAVLFPLVVPSEETVLGAIFRVRQ